MPRTSFRGDPHSIVCLNVKELLAWGNCHIWSLSDNNGIRTHNHLVRKRKLKHLSKLVRLRTEWLWVRIQLLSFNLVLTTAISASHWYPFLMKTTGDFNAKSKNWYSQNKTSLEDKTIKYNFTIWVISVI